MTEGVVSAGEARGDGWNVSLQIVPVDVMQIARSCCPQTLLKDRDAG